MQKNLLLYFSALLLMVILISGTLNNTGSPGRKTGSPLDGRSCTECHTGTAIQVEWISTNIPETGWTPGETYNITLNAAHETAKKIGFELTAENSSEKTGVFKISDASRMRFSIQDKAITHKDVGNVPTNGENAWEMQWTAPAENKGDITFYAAINAANGNGNTSGDTIFTSSLLVAQDPSTTTNVAAFEKASLKVFPNPASNFVFIESVAEIELTSIFSSNGQLIKSTPAEQQKRIKLAVNDLRKGMYLVHVKTDQGDFVRKIQIN